MQTMEGFLGDGGLLSTIVSLPPLIIHRTRHIFPYVPIA